MSMKRMLSEKGHELIVVNNYKFRQYRIAKKTGEMCWCCTKKSCRAKIYTVGPDLLISRQTGKHEHTPLSNALLNRQEINNAITLQTKRLDETQFCDKPQNLISNAIQTNDHVLETLNATDIKYIGKNVTRAKHILNIKLQNSLEQVNDYLEVVDVKLFPVFNMDNFDIGKFKIGFIGGGNMATAVVAGLLNKQVTKPDKIWISTLTEETKERWKTDFHVNVASNNGEIFNICDIVILAVKPQVLDDALRHALHFHNKVNMPSNNEPLYVISVLAGVTLETLRLKLQPFNPTQVIRTMPNTPLMVGEGITVYSYDESKVLSTYGLSGIEDKIITCIFATMGIAEKVPEKLINPISALAGSGPAYVYLMIEALADGAVRMGVPRVMANTYAAQIMVGAGQMVLQTGKHPGLLKDEVCSPNGTTITGIHALERGGVRGHLMNAVEAATRRSDELSKTSN